MNSKQELERLFKAGTAAYQQGDYVQAVATFSGLSRAKSGTYRLKASMGLVQAYIAQKNWPAAQGLCQKIGNSSNPDLQRWSSKTLEKIKNKSLAERNVRSESSQVKSKSGFQPLSAAHVSKISTAPDSPLEISTKSSSINNSSKKRPSNNSLKKSPPRKSPLATKCADSIADHEPPAGLSMFHYAYLNGEDDVPGHSEPAQEEAFCWTYAGRLPKGRSLGKMKRGQLWAMQIGGAIALYVLWRMLIRQTVAMVNGYLTFLDNVLPFEVPTLPSSWQDMTWSLLIVLGVLVIAAPWLWDLWLRFSAQRQSFSASALRSQSAEAAKVINTKCRQRRWPFPTLWKLPTDIPLLFSYGWLPRNARIVVSQGLLNQLKEDEIAALVAYEMSHWKSWHWPLLSAHGLVLQIMLWLYWQISLRANRWEAQGKPWFQYLAGMVASVIYGVFWLSRVPALGMCRVRTYFSDRAATVFTGNPNGLTRALAKLSFGLAANVEQQGHTSILIEGLLPLLPVATDLARYRLYGQLPLSQLFAWDSQNPLSTWMSGLDTHPPLGNRLRLLSAYAQHWKLAPEIRMPKSATARRGLSAKRWQWLAKELTPYAGLAIGIGIGIGLLSVGAIAATLNEPTQTVEATADAADEVLSLLNSSTSTAQQAPSPFWSALAWMHKDFALFQSCALLGASIGTMLRINRFFPDLSFSTPPTHDVSSKVSDPSLLPAASLPIKLSGELLGRPGVANWLGQDLLLKMHCGLLPLHHFSFLGPLGNMPMLTKKPTKLTSGRPIQVLGWFRRGSQPWIDVDKIRLNNGSFVQGTHPVCSLLLAVAASATALWLLVSN